MELNDNITMIKIDSTKKWKYKKIKNKKSRTQLQWLKSMEPKRSNWKQNSRIYLWWPKSMEIESSN